ncbi:MAG: hypothetical protein ACE5L6_02165 [Candidatus Bathyarchaeia archaeon]
MPKPPLKGHMKTAPGEYFLLHVLGDGRVKVQCMPINSITPEFVGYYTKVRGGVDVVYERDSQLETLATILRGFTGNILKIERWGAKILAYKDAGP